MENIKYVIEEFAGIEYYGNPDGTQECVNAVLRLIQFNDVILKASILTCNNSHGLLLYINVGDLVAIKPGFASGYPGVGPRGFSYVLQLLNAYNVEIEEYEIEPNFMDRLEHSCLTLLDIKSIESEKPIHPSRWYYYIYEEDLDGNFNERIWKKFPNVLPLSSIDTRITDLAKSFWENPDEKLLTGYRRLEDIVRERCSIKEHSSKLFSKAFQNPKPLLIWADLDESEQIGRANLFTSTYLAYRNPRAHKEMEKKQIDLISEFLLLNHLFLLECTAMVNPETIENIIL
jgi:hypothetical protein